MDVTYRDEPQELPKQPADPPTPCFNDPSRAQTAVQWRVELGLQSLAHVAPNMKDLFS
jgi:hypothetical protein